MTAPVGTPRVHDNIEAPYDTPLWVRAGSEMLFGVLTTPAGPPRQQAVVLVAPHFAGAAGGALEKNYFNVALARSLAKAGFRVFRYDMRGTGDSTGMEREFNLGRLHTDGLFAVVAELRRRGMDKLVLIGKCGGARTVAAAARRVPGLQGAVLISMPLLPPGMGTHDLNHDRIRPSVGMLLGLLDGRRRLAVLRALWAWLRGTGRRMRWPFPRVHPTILRQVGDLIRARVPLLLLWGNNDGDYANFVRATKGALGTVLAQGRACVQMRVLDGNVHEWTSLRIQQQTVACLEKWMEHAASGRRR
ncbi:MAG TPA: alpha/beta fold hydrolase [bacterium]|nr:alpha/beta fold hydrolase [bacterium]